MQSSDIPKPQFKTCDETSMKLTWDQASFAQALQAHPTAQVALEYKEAPQPWDLAKRYTIPSNKIMEVSLQEADLVDLNPGTPYMLRVVVIHTDSNTTVYGPETVFDTKPVDCVPKKKKCVIS